MRTLPKAPLPTTLNRRKWLRLTGDTVRQVSWTWKLKCDIELTFVGQNHRLALRVAHLATPEGILAVRSGARELSSKSVV